MSKRKKSSGPLLFGLIVVALAAVGYGAGPGKWFEGEEVQALDGVPVRRGDLRISEISRGNLEAKDSEKLTNELEGRATILHLVEEGTFVEKGDLVCELDVSEQRDRRISQEIAVKNRQADFTKAKEQYDIQVIQNESDIAKAKLDLKLAELELKKYVEENGEWTHELAKADEAITVAREELKQSEDTLKWTQELFEKGFAQRTELERDELAVEKQRIKVTQAVREKSLMELYEHEKRTAELEAAVATAKREVAKVEKQALAKLADNEAARSSAEFELAREEERLEKIDDQLGKARILAPVSGMVVYARERSGRMGTAEVPQEGTEVRERQVIATIPKEGGMIADVSLHETKLDKVKAGLRCLVTVDAIPGKVFQGKVSFVAAVADSGSWMSNPNQRLYKTEVALLETSRDMRPGMSCELEILVDELKDVLYVPRQAVFMDGDRTVCFVNGPNGVEAVEVETGLDNNSWVVVESGLAEGQTVMLSPPASWEPAPASRELTEDPGVPAGFDAVPTAESAGAAPGGGERGGGERGGGARADGERGGRPPGGAEGRGGGFGGFGNLTAEERAARLEEFKNSDRYKSMTDEQKAQMESMMGGGGGK